jgi:tRNA A-37 threonylcarbamoyl transferase component Bud32
VSSATRQYKQYFKSEIDVELVHHRIEKNFNLLPTARKKENYINEIVKSYNKLKEWGKFDKKSQEWKDIKSM